MNHRAFPIWLTGLIMTGSWLAACNAPTSGTKPTQLAGWYLQHGREARFQACGRNTAVRLSATADLRQRANQFELDDDTPIYVRIEVDASESEPDVLRVLQFGSPTPVRNCGLTGVVTPS